MKNLILVFLGSGFGGGLRYGISLLLKPGTESGKFPLATFISNTLACLLAAWLVNRLFPQLGNDGTARLLLLTGFCGGFSTFSALSLETAGLLKSGNWTMAIFYILLSLASGIAAFWIFNGESVSPGR
jgi:CrcB protein